MYVLEALLQLSSMPLCLAMLESGVRLRYKALAEEAPSIQKLMSTEKR